jgi:hypothetical protein
MVNWKELPILSPEGVSPQESIEIKINSLSERIDSLEKKIDLISRHVIEIRKMLKTQQKEEKSTSLQPLEPEEESNSGLFESDIV